MRLIDADALLDFLDVGHLRPPTEICFSELMMKNIIELMPTVDAIPIEWILNHERMPKEGKTRKAIMDMIADWTAERKEE